MLGTLNCAVVTTLVSCNSRLRSQLARLRTGCSSYDPVSWFLDFQDRLDLQDALRSCQWNVGKAIEKVKADMQSFNQAGKKASLLPKKKRKPL